MIRNRPPSKLEYRFVTRRHKRKGSLFNSSVCFYVVIIWTAAVVFVSVRWVDKPCLSVANSQHAEKPQLQPIPVFRALRVGRWDSSREYKMFDHVVVGEKFRSLSESSLVTLATQADPKHFYHIFELRKHWQGPLSLALFAGGEEERLILELQLRFLLQCHAEIASTMSIHLAVPKIPREGTWNISYLEQSLDKLEHDLRCELQEEAFQKIVELWKPNKDEKPKKSMKYPQNHMRNLARKNCQTSFVFLVDVDILPSFNLWQRLEEFLRKESDGKGTEKRKIAYVLPTFEVKETATFPKSKEDMVKLAEQGLARPFHLRVWKPNQMYTNFKRWQKEVDSGEELRVAYNITAKIRLGYEPFYVAHDDVPPHDERFVGYGFTRNTQVYEMVAAGYTFAVLSPAFTVHWGFHLLSSLPNWRLHQIYKNSRKEKTFKAELTARYGIEPSDFSQLQPSKPKIRTVKAETPNSKPEKSARKPDIPTLDPNIENPNPETQSPEPEVSTLKPEVSTLEPEVSTLEPEVSTLDPEVSTLEPEVSTIEP